ncbi:MAG: YggU family protein [Nitrospinae bacterium RIFCSPLOWO2_12_39_16]|nr:MAG: YggU family protein [Nitrospinae bacterium RIFCSPLOWO2_12_39_16]
MLNLKEDKNGVVFTVKVQPRSSKNEICGIYGDAVKIKLTSPPVEGEANESLINFLSKSLNISKGQIEIIGGHKSKNKLIKMRGVKRERIEECLKQ